MPVIADDALIPASRSKHQSECCISTYSRPDVGEEQYTPANQRDSHIPAAVGTDRRRACHRHRGTAHGEELPVTPIALGYSTEHF
jgi:hypothetical protein